MLQYLWFIFAKQKLVCLLKIILDFCCQQKINILCGCKWKIYLIHHLIILFYLLIQRFKDWKDLSESELFPGLESEPLKKGAHCTRCGHLGEYILNNEKDFCYYKLYLAICLHMFFSC